MKTVSGSNLGLLKSANQQLQKLKNYKNKVLGSCFDSSVTNNQEIKIEIQQKSLQVLGMYKSLLEVYQLQPITHNDKTDAKSNRYMNKTDFRQKRLKSNGSPFPILNQDINLLVMGCSLSCTLSYIYTNFLNNFEQSTAILLKSKSQLMQLIAQLQQNNFEFPIQDNQTYQSLFRSYARVVTNLVLGLITQKKFTFAVEIFDQFIRLIDSISDSQIAKKTLQYVCHTWFGTKNVDFLKSCRFDSGTWLDKLLKQERQFSVNEAISLSHLVFNSDILTQKSELKNQTYPQKFITILQKSNETFISHQMYEHSFFTLRHLLQSPIDIVLRQKYYLHLRQLLEEGHLNSDIEMENIESVQCFRCLIEAFDSMLSKYKDFNVLYSTSNKDYCKVQLFRTVIKISKLRIKVNQNLSKDEKNSMTQNLDDIIKDQNQLIIQQLFKSESVVMIINEVNLKYQIISKIISNKLQYHFRCFKQNLQLSSTSKKFAALEELSVNEIENSSISSKSLRGRNISPSHRRYLKLISTSIHTESSVTTHRNRIFQSDVSSRTNKQKKFNNMIRICEVGAELNKRNFNSDGGEFKFIRLTKDEIKWSKSAETIEKSFQTYALKDIKGILYGKVTPNLKKPCNKNLREQLCFSFILQKRTMDFYCKDYNQVQAWVCGASMILKRQNESIVGYTPGKMRWRKMFALLRLAFIQPLKTHHKNEYYFENAYSLILFKRNGYRLPQRK